MASLFPTAGEICTATATLPEIADILEIPILAVKEEVPILDAASKATQARWQFISLKYLAQPNPSAGNQIRTLVCVKETLEPVGCYTPSGASSLNLADCTLAPIALKRHWNARAVRLKDKQVTGSIALEGGSPPQSVPIGKDLLVAYIPGTEGVAGNEPIMDLVRWIQEKRHKP